jgi:hypothetical protein
MSFIWLKGRTPAPQVVINIALSGHWEISWEISSGAEVVRHLKGVNYLRKSSLPDYRVYLDVLGRTWTWTSGVTYPGSVIAEERSH